VFAATRGWVPLAPLAWMNLPKGVVMYRDAVRTGLMVLVLLAAGAVIAHNPAPAMARAAPATARA
jgi:hypothetical protein